MSPVTVLSPWIISPMPYHYATEVANQRQMDKIILFPASSRKDATKLSFIENITAILVSSITE